jgi:hypothetical protein
VIEDGDFYYIQFKEMGIPISLKNEGKFDKE